MKYSFKHPVIRMPTLPPRNAKLACHLVLVVVVLTLCTACGARTAAVPTQRPYIVKNVRYYPLSSSGGYVDTGIASWYGRKFHGRRTSNGERYNMHAETAAHKILPMNTMLLVENLENGRNTVVRINDRGPFVRGRIVDLSYSSAKKLGIVGKGTARVRITALAPSRNGILVKTPNFREGEFYVQIGAFVNLNNALRLKKRFTDAGHVAVIRKAAIDSESFYRVQVYSGTQLVTAKRAERALLKRGYHGAFIVAR